MTFGYMVDSDRIKLNMNAKLTICSHSWGNDWFPCTARDTKKRIKVQNIQIKCEWHTCESLFTLQSIPAFCLSSPSGQGPLNLHAVKRIHTNTHPQCVQSSRHTHTHTPLFKGRSTSSHTVLSGFFLVLQREGGEISFWGLAGSSLNSTHCKLKPYSWRWSLISLSGGRWKHPVISM